MNMKIEMIKCFLGVTAIALLLVIGYLENKYPRPKPVEEKEKFDSPVIICPECKGSGEKIQDVNKMMMEAKCAIWMNGHTARDAGCKECKIIDNKYEYCEKAKFALAKFVEEYEKSGPEMSESICPGCMGGGTMKQIKPGVWMIQERL